MLDSEFDAKRKVLFKKKLLMNKGLCVFSLLKFFESSVMKPFIGGWPLIDITLPRIYVTISC